MYKIRSLLHRPPPDLPDKLATFGVAMIADSMGRYGAMRNHIKPLYRGIRMAGPAMTVQTFRADNLMLHTALELAEAGDIVVADAGGVEDAGIWGGLMTAMAQKKGVGGLVTDGSVRDTAEIIQVGFPVFSGGYSPLGTFKNSPGSVGVPIACGGVVIHPGDIVVGDDDGVAVVPLGLAETVLQLCEETFAKEQALRRNMESGKSLFEQLNLQKSLEDLGLTPE